MKEIADLAAVFTGAIESAIDGGEVTGLDEVDFHFNYIDNYSAQDILKHDDKGYHNQVIIEPPAEWAVSLRTGIGLEENECDQAIELSVYVLQLNMYVLQRDASDSGFFNPDVRNLAGQTLYYKHVLTNYTPIDDCIVVLQKLFEAVEYYTPGTFQITEPDIKVDVLPPGITSKEEVGINAKVNVKWF